LLGEAARPLAGGSFLLEEFLEREREAGRWRLPFRQTGESVLVHTHCHQKALVGSGSLVGALGDAYRVREAEAGCCGMAGSFGYETEHYPLSVAVAGQRLLPALERAPGAPVVAPGASCRQQILDLTGRRALHPAEALAGAVGIPLD
jgi:Fe-S oxidoreductase